MGRHTPVLLREVLEALAIRADGRYVDATFGRGGHTAAVLERLNAQGRVVALDRDPDALRAGRERFADEARLTLMASPFSRLAALLEEMGLVGRIDGVLLDLGVSSPQLDDAARGFSFAHDLPAAPTMSTLDYEIPLIASGYEAAVGTAWTETFHCLPHSWVGQLATVRLNLDVTSAGAQPYYVSSAYARSLRPDLCD